MHRKGLFVSMWFVLLSGLVATGCKKAEEKKAPTEAKTGDNAGDNAAEDVKAVPVVLDIGKIDAMLAKLADATIASATKAKAFPKLKSDLGIACGTDEDVATALAHVGIEVGTLKTDGGFSFDDVCVGWRPRIPTTEMYWMISGGEADEKGALATRRCVRVLVAEGAYSKLDVVDGPCLSIHEGGRQAPIIETDGAKPKTGEEAKTVEEAKPGEEPKPEAGEGKAKEAAAGGETKTK